MLTKRPKTKTAVTQKIQGSRNCLGFVDGQTTNPTLVSKNPEIRKLIASGYRLSTQQEMAEHRKIVQTFRRCLETLEFPMKSSLSVLR
jgi:transaldolase